MRAGIPRTFWRASTMLNSGPIGTARHGMSINQRVAQFAQNHLGQRVRRGECFDLADRALRSAGAASAADYGRVTPRGDYQWGLGVMPSSAQVGDIVQFRNFRVDFSDERGEGWETRGAPNHTAIIAAVEGDGRFEIWEQNYNNVRRVTRTIIYLTSNPPRSRVSGRVSVYRPQPAD